MPFGPNDDGDLPDFSITVGGKPIPDAYDVVSIEISHEIGAIPFARIVLADGSIPEETFAVSESSTFVPGGELIVSLGYTGKLKTAFTGVITAQRIEALAETSSRLIVEAKHACFRMAHARKSRVWINTTDADAIRDLAGAHGLSFKGASDAARPQLVQHQASDWDFATLRAERIGQLLVAGADGSLEMLKPEAVEPSGASLAYGVSLLGFALELDAGGQPESVETGAWDPANQQMRLENADPKALLQQGDISGNTLARVADIALAPRHPGMRDAAELKDWAQAELVRCRLAGISGSVEAPGGTGVAPGQTVELERLGARFNGDAFVSGVRHMLQAGDWRTTLRIGLDPAFQKEREDVSAPPAAGLAPAISGLQIGVVKALTDDPAGEGRVAVTIPTQAGVDQAVWARPLSIGGGAGRGLVMLPEPGDECLLGFLDGDPRDPVLLGGLHSSAAASPMPADETNTLKGMVTRKGMKIAFDDEAVSLVLETPGGNRVTLSDKDAEGLLLEDRHGNGVRLDEAGISLTDRTGNSAVFSTSGVELKSRGDITLGADGNVRIEGSDVTVKAQMQAGVEGGATATLESAGETVVKGAMVKIN